MMSEDQDMGALSGSHASHEAPAGLRPSGFDPARGLHILQHSLGVDRHGQGEQYRRHFVTGPGSVDYADCMALTEAGLMTRRSASDLSGGMDLFLVTPAGRAYVAEYSPPPPKLTRGQRRYREWLDVSDATGETFMEFCRRRDRRLKPEGPRRETGSVAQATKAPVPEGQSPQSQAGEDHV